MDEIDNLIKLIEPELHFEAVKSSGPGGQHVNKTNTKVIMRWDVANSRVLDPTQRQVILEKLITHINKDEILIIKDQTTRSQLINKENSIIKLKKLLQKAFFKTKPRKATKPTKASQIRRIEQKKRLSAKKEERRRKE